MNVRSIISIGILIVIVISLLAYLLLPINDAITQPIEVRIIIMEIGENENVILKENILSLFQKSTVFDALRKVSDVKYSEYPGLGVFVESIDGKSNTTEKWWLYKVNNSYPNVSASRFLLENGDVIIWEYTSFFPF